jgi:hypothetical protein
MKERPILFSTEMVNAIIAGRKTQTRRIINPQPTDSWMNNAKSICPSLNMYRSNGEQMFWISDGNTRETKNRYGQPGDLLWVRETYCRMFTVDANDNEEFLYKAIVGHEEILKTMGWKWKPSIFMLKAAARIWLQIKEIHVKRLQDISEEDSIAEGVVEYEDGTFKNYFKVKGLRAEDGVECLLAKGSYQSLWHNINGKNSWDSNPWVWVITFKVISTTGRPEEVKEMEVANG